MEPFARRYRLANTARTAKVVTGGVEVMSRTLEFDTFRVLQAFEQARTIEEVFIERCIDDTLEGFAAHVRLFERWGLLRAEGEEREEEGLDLRAALSPALQDPELFARIATWLAAGRAVAIPDALRTEIADELHQALDSCDQWRPLEVNQPFFRYRTHHIADETAFPPALRACRALFASSATKRFAAELGGVDCSGLPTFDASWYQPGEYSLPHSDAGELRALAFVWHLTRDWSPTYGGELFWCPTGRALTPQFNCLTLFKVTPGSTHMVCPVSTTAVGKRLAVAGWWNSLTKEWPKPGSSSSAMSPWIEGYAPSNERIADPRVLVF